MSTDPISSMPDRLRLLEDILDHIDVDVAVLDPDLRFEYVNPASIPDPELRAWLVGRTNRDYCRRRGKPMALAEARERDARAVLEAGVRREEMEEIRDASGTVHHVLRVHLPVVGADGTVRRIIGYGFDRTEAVRVARELRRREEAANESLRLDATGRLAGGVAHEFNNLLTSIRAQAELLAEDATARGEAVPAGVGEILAGADRAAGLVAHLLAFSRSGPARPERVDLGGVVEAFLDDIRADVGPGIDLEARPPAAPVSVFADRDHLRDVLVSLTRNSVAAMPSGGSLTFAWGPADVPGHARLVVADTGVGMDEGTRARAFEPFFTTDRDGRRPGLGLSVVHGVVTRAGGTVSLESEPGRGARVEIRLPIDPGDQGP